MAAKLDKLISGTEAMLEQLLMLFSDEFHPQWGSTRIVKLNTDAGEVYDLKLSQVNHSIGRFKIIAFPGNRVLLKSLSIGAIEHDPEGAHFAEFCREVTRRCEGYGLLSRRSRLDSAAILDTASRQMNAADTPEAFAAVGISAGPRSSVWDASCLTRFFFCQMKSNLLLMRPRQG